MRSGIFALVCLTLSSCSLVPWKNTAYVPRDNEQALQMWQKEVAAELDAHLGWSYALPRSTGMRDAEYRVEFPGVNIQGKVSGPIKSDIPQNLSDWTMTGTLSLKTARPFFPTSIDEALDIQIRGTREGAIIGITPEKIGSQQKTESWLTGIMQPFLQKTFVLPYKITLSERSLGHLSTRLRTVGLFTASAEPREQDGFVILTLTSPDQLLSELFGEDLFPPQTLCELQIEKKHASKSRLTCDNGFLYSTLEGLTMTIPRRGGVTSIHAGDIGKKRIYDIQLKNGDTVTSDIQIEHIQSDISVHEWKYSGTWHAPKMTWTIKMQETKTQDESITIAPMVNVLEPDALKNITLYQ